MTDREQTRRDAQANARVIDALYERLQEAELQRDEAFADVASVERDRDALLAELEQSERERDECQKTREYWMANQQHIEGLRWMERAKQAEARLAKEPALVEALRQIIALPVPRAVEAIELADEALADYEKEQTP